MGFSLTIAQGNDQGTEYTFNQPEVSIGRTAENDVVLSDPGVSRKHVVLREESGQYLLQDQDSANGTLVNDQPVKETDLQDGDQISIGPVVFLFASMPDAGANSTRIFNAAELANKVQSTKKVREQAQASAGPRNRAVTSMSPSLKNRQGGNANAGGNNGGSSGSRGGQMVKSSGNAPVKKTSGTGNKLASEKAREHRQAKTLGAKIALAWNEADKRVQKGITVVGALAGVAVILFVVKALVNPGGGGGGLGNRPEDNTTFEIGGAPSQDCWGLKPEGGIHYTPDKAQFDFNFPVTDKKALATLHFVSGLVTKSDLVDISVNTVRQGFVSRAFADEMRPQEIPLAPKFLKPNDRNHIVFDNLKNPPGEEPWVICKVWVEIQQLPSGSPTELKEQAKQYIEVGDRRYHDKLIGARNLFDAWLNYKKAKLFLDAMDEKIDEYDLLKQKIRDSEHELDEQCSKLLLKAQADEQNQRWAQAIGDYKYGLTFFPEKDHPCFQQLTDHLNNIQ